MKIQIYATSTPQGNRYGIDFDKTTICYLTANDMHKLKRELKEWGYK